MKRLAGSKSFFVLGLVFMIVFSLAGCSSGNSAASTPTPAASDAGSTTSSPSPSPSPTPAAKKLMAVTQVTNWFAEAEHGGNYTALVKGFYKDAGLDMTIQSGGPGISATQIVGSGKAQFGMGQADEILLARANGIPLVAIMATFQTNPQALMFHGDQNIKSVSDLNGRKVYVSAGSTYWEYFQKKYKLDKVTQMKYTGDLTAFINDPTSVIQCYITSEPYTMKQKGIDIKYLLNADSGFSPYGNIMYTTESFLKEHPDEVKAFVEATVKGWNYYKDNYQEIDPDIQKKNPDTPLDALDYGAKALQPLVFEGDAAKYGVGYMSKQRWDELGQQLVSIGLIKSSEDVSKAYTTDFLPKQ